MTHYLEKLRSNAKGGFDIALTPCTLVVGEHGFGKSAVRTCLELVLRGEAGDFGKTGQRIMEMAPEGAPEFWIEGTVSDGKVLRFSVEGSMTKASRPVWTVSGEPVGKAPAVILSDEVATLMKSKTDKTLRKELLSVTVGTIDPDIVTEEIPKAYRQLWQPRWERALEDKDTIADAILAARVVINNELAEIRARKRGDLGQRPAAPTADQIDAMGRKVWEIRQKLEHARAEMAQPPVFAQPVLSVRAVAETPEMAEIRHGLEGISASVRVLELMRQMAADDGVYIPCLTCRAGQVFSRDQIDQALAERRGQEQAIRERLAAQVSAAAAASQQAEIAQPAQPAAAPGPDLGALEAELQEAERTHGDALAAQTAQEAWDKAAAAQRHAGADEKVHKALREAVDSAIGVVLQARVASFEERATAYLPEAERLKIALVGDKGKAICRVGMEGGRRPGFRTWRALCGAERAQAMGAIAGAWGSSREEAIRLGLLDEVWLSRRGLLETCGGLRQAVYEGGLTQVVVFAVEAAETPEGWSRVELPGVG